MQNDKSSHAFKKRVFVKDPRTLCGNDIEVLLNSLHFCVVQKPVNVVVVEGRGVPRPTLLELVQERFGRGVLPVHRLDRVTSGCIVFAKSSFGEQVLVEAFRRRHVDKRYLALVEGVPEFNKLNVDAALLRVDAPKAKKGAVAWQILDEKGQRAVTRLRVLARGKRFSVVEARPETGRMHQIRVHLASLGHAILGDKLYGAELNVSSHLGAHAVGLHALAVSVPAPKGGRAYAVASLPPHWVALLDEEGIAIAPILERALTKFGKKEAAASLEAAKENGHSKIIESKDARGTRKFAKQMEQQKKKSGEDSKREGQRREKSEGRVLSRKKRCSKGNGAFKNKSSASGGKKSKKGIASAKRKKRRR